MTFGRLWGTSSEGLRVSWDLEEPWPPRDLGWPLIDLGINQGQ